MLIYLKDVTKSFFRGNQEICVLKNITLRISKGEFVSIMGPSGAGKSTLLHLIAGIETPTSGDIIFERNSLSTMSEDELTHYRRKKIGIIFQLFYLLPLLTVEENIALPMLISGSPSHEVRRNVGLLLDLVGLTQRRNHMPNQLSGGEIQRVAIARAMVNNPVLLLADEPTGNLDAKSGEEILNLIKSFSTHYDQTILLATHDTKVAGYADRVITLYDGSIIDN